MVRMTSGNGTGSKPAPWEKKGERRVLGESREFNRRLFAQDFINPKTGGTDEYVFYEQSGWAVVLPITSAGEVIAIREFRHGAGAVLLNLPAGHLDVRGETPEENIRRELEEETGYIAGEIIPLGPPLFISAGHSPTRFFPFLATECALAQGPAHENDKETVVEVMPLERWVMLCREEVVEPSSIVATFRALPHLGYKMERGL